MIKEIKQKLKKYMDIAKDFEYVSVHEVVNDLSYLLGEVRIKRLPKKDR